MPSQCSRGIITDRDIRVYYRPGDVPNRFLVKSKVVPRGTFLQTGEVTVMCFDHQDVMVAVLLDHFPGHYVLWSDVEDAVKVNGQLV